MVVYCVVEGGVFDESWDVVGVGYVVVENGSVGVRKRKVCFLWKWVFFFVECWELNDCSVVFNWGVKGNVF